MSLWLRVRVLGPSANGANGAHEFAELAGSARDWPIGKENLLLRAFDRGAEAFGVGRRALRFAVDSEIPIARGLGSSGAAIAAGLSIAAATSEREVSVEELLALGLEMEGHPDNTSAALVGGCTLSVPRAEGGVCVVRQELHEGLAFALAWPETRIATSAARAVLPREVKLVDAVENPRRLALLLEGLRSGDAELLGLGAEDRLHVKYRLPLIPNGESALEAARAHGAWLATISGSGSALVAIGAHERVAEIAAAMKEELAIDGKAEGRVVTPVMGRPRVERIE